MTDLTKLTDMTEAQRARLPAYAREYMEALERTLRDTEDTLFQKWAVLPPKRWRGGKIDDPRHEQGIIVNPNGENPLAIHKDMCVRFWIETGKTFIDVQIVRTRPGPAIQLMGERSIDILPSASNVAYIKGADW